MLYHSWPLWWQSWRQEFYTARTSHDTKHIAHQESYFYATTPRFLFEFKTDVIHYEHLHEKTPGFKARGLVRQN